MSITEPAVYAEPVTDEGTTGNGWSEPGDGSVSAPPGRHGAEGADPADGRQGISSVEFAMAVLTALELRRAPMSLSQVAQAAGMQPSRAHRYLVSLGRTGLVSQSPTSGLYDLGPALRRLGVEALRRTDEVGTVSARLPGLRDRTGHSVNLAVWGDRGPVVVRWDYGSYPLPITVRVGATLPLLTSSVGIVCLTHLPKVVTDPVVKAELAAAPDSAAARERMVAAVGAARECGYAITSGGIIPGVTSLAAPVVNASGTLPLVVAVALPAAQASGKVIAAIAADLLETTASLGDELGWSPPSGD